MSNAENWEIYGGAHGVRRNDGWMDYRVTPEHCLSLLREKQETAELDGPT